MSLKGTTGVILILALVLLSAVEPVYAQCAMCKSTIANSEDPAELARTVNAATLVLFIPVMIIIGAIAALVFKHRNPGR
jgi:hypothetical protein